MCVCSHFCQDSTFSLTKSVAEFSNFMRMTENQRQIHILLCFKRMDHLITFKNNGIFSLELKILFHLLSFFPRPKITWDLIPRIHHDIYPLMSDSTVLRRLNYNVLCTAFNSEIFIMSIYIKISAMSLWHEKKIHGY